MKTKNITLTTDRLLLRPYQESDWQAVYEYASIPEVCQYQPWGPNTEEETQQFVRQCIQENQQDERSAYHFAMVRQKNAVFVGGCTIRITNAGQREAMVGYTIGPRFWNLGYTTEAVRALFAFGFGELVLHRITSWCTPENIGSWRVMEKAGMRREGHEREAIFFKGQWQDWLRYAILDHEWKARNP